ncbi:MAG: ferrous iron transport protein A [Bacteroidia bacterium]|nr:ferrous iron transport protein A [Bacteroidia bacterium]MDW8302977.1 FeoA family protein [Bacteroidia bacterium]
MLKLAELKVGDKGYISQITNLQVQFYLLNMGCTPQASLEVVNIAPLGDPIAIKVGNTILSIRKRDAQYIQIQKQDTKN